MAWASKGTMGTYANTANNQTGFTLTTATTTLSAGDVGVIIIAVDNNQTTDGDEACVSNVTDSAGNTWTKGGEFTNGQGAALAGTTCSVWWVKATSTLSTGGTITGTFSNSANRDESAGTAWAFTVGAGSTISRPESPATAANDAADVGALDVTTPNEERLRIRAISEEANDGTQMTATASWTLFTNQRSANIATAQAVRGEFIISTGTGASSNPTLSVTTGDYASVYISLKETASTFSNDPSMFAVLQ